MQCVRVYGKIMPAYLKYCEKKAAKSKFYRPALENGCIRQVFLPLSGVKFRFYKNFAVRIIITILNIK